MAQQRYYRQRIKIFNITKKYFKYPFMLTFSVKFVMILLPCKLIKMRFGIGYKPVYISRNIPTPMTIRMKKIPKFSDQEHTVLIYIDAKLDVEAFGNFSGRTIASEKLEKGAKFRLSSKKFPRCQSIWVCFPPKVQDLTSL